MNLFLKAKHWQLFFLTYIVPLILKNYLVVPVNFDTMKHFNQRAYIESSYKAFGAEMLIILIFMILVLGWQYSIAIGLQSRLPPGYQMNTKKFKRFFFLAAVYFLAFMLFRDFIKTLPFEVVIILSILIVCMHLFTMFCIIHNMIFVAKTLRSVELQREATSGEYIGYFFLVWFSFVGYWILQPKINEIIANTGKKVSSNDLLEY